MSHLLSPAAVVCVLFMAGAAATEQTLSQPPLPTTARNFRLDDHLGKSHELYRSRDAKAVVLFFAGNGCPIVRKSVPAFKEIRDEYASKGIVFLMINGNPNDERATAILGELGILPQKATLQLAYRWADTGADSADNPKDNAWTVGGTYQIAQNVQLQAQYTSRSKGGAANAGRYPGSETPGSALTTFMLSAGF